MPIFLRILLIIVSILTVYFVLIKIRKAQLQIEDSIFWFLFSFSLLIVSVIPNFVITLSAKIGIESPANFVFLVIIFILLLKEYNN